MRGRSDDRADQSRRAEDGTHGRRVGRLHARHRSADGPDRHLGSDHATRARQPRRASTSSGCARMARPTVRRSPSRARTRSRRRPRARFPLSPGKNTLRFTSYDAAGRGARSLARGHHRAGDLSGALALATPRFFLARSPFELRALAGWPDAVARRRRDGCARPIACWSRSSTTVAARLQRSSPSSSIRRVTSLVTLPRAGTALEQQGALRDSAAAAWRRPSTCSKVHAPRPRKTRSSSMVPVPHRALEAEAVGLVVGRRL